MSYAANTIIINKVKVDEIKGERKISFLFIVNVNAML